MLFRIPFEIQGLYLLLYSLLVIFFNGIYLSMIESISSKKLLKDLLASLVSIVASQSIDKISSRKFSLS